VIPELRIAKEAALAAGALLQRFQKSGFKLRLKGRIDLVTEVDEKAQDLIIKMIRKRFPSDSFLTEEAPAQIGESSERLWIIDPIDGTTNYAHGYPCYCVSIAFRYKNKLQVGVIYDPTRKELFFARRSHGAFLGRKRLQVSSCKSLEKALLVTGFPYDLHDPKLDNLKDFSKMLYEARAIRRDGSAALNLAYTAAGRFDGFWEKGLKAWDIAAGLLILQESGGKTIALDDSCHGELPSALCAANPQLLKQMCKVLGKGINLLNK